jgi:hypothetical protein
LRPTSSFGTILASHVIIRELFFRPKSPFGNCSSVRRYTRLPSRARARTHTHTHR